TAGVEFTNRIVGNVLGQRCPRRAIAQAEGPGIRVGGPSSHLLAEADLAGVAVVVDLADAASLGHRQLDLASDYLANALGTLEVIVLRALLGNDVGPSVQRHHLLVGDVVVQDSAIRPAD